MPKFLQIEALVLPILKASWISSIPISVCKRCIGKGIRSITCSKKVTVFVAVRRLMTF